MQPITDEYIRSRDTVTTKEAAAYLGMNWWKLTDMLQQGKAPFGIACLGKGGRCTYTIWGERLFQFKKAKDMQPAPLDERIERKLDEAIKLYTELIELLNERKEGAA